MADMSFPDRRFACNRDPNSVYPFSGPARQLPPRQKGERPGAKEFSLLSKINKKQGAVLALSRCFLSVRLSCSIVLRLMEIRLTTGDIRRTSSALEREEGMLAIIPVPTVQSVSQACLPFQSQGHLEPNSDSEEYSRHLTLALANLIIYLP
ncbi:hypothetical protein HAX54_044121 [Datura stramonium]|uniref:Uncharacterized protein n=1 Tax=Datura stramonium TaxID=4076 RepID=A0ABS8W5L9_DATST|nr:hypothetical protein [Datura stramonium]